MKIIEPSVKEITDFEGVDNFYKASARAARICYASDKTTDDKELCERLIKSGHLSPFEHSVIYIPLYGKIRELTRSLQVNFKNDYMIQFINHIQESKYVVSTYNPSKQHYDLSINGRVIVETITSLCATNKFFSSYIEALDFVLDNLKDYEIKLHNFKSFIVDTSIGCTREMNRHHDNFYICEQSTRYCNFSKDKFGNEVSFNKPYWFIDNPPSNFINLSPEEYEQELWKQSMEFSEKMYLKAIEHEMPVDIARGILPLDTHTKAIYTATVEEWNHFIDLRFKGTTGKPHGDIKIIAEKINNIINKE